MFPPQTIRGVCQVRVLNIFLNSVSETEQGKKRNTYHQEGVRTLALSSVAPGKENLLEKRGLAGVVTGEKWGKERICGIIKST